MKKTCKNCGSDNIVFDAWIKWNPDTNSFEIYDTFDNVYCLDCEHTNTEVNEIE